VAHTRRFNAFHSCVDHGFSFGSGISSSARNLAPRASVPGNLDVTVLLVEASSSMKKGGLLDRVKQNAGDYIMKSTSACTLAIVGVD
jgi:hypothetical protein